MTELPFRSRAIRAIAASDVSAPAKVHGVMLVELADWSTGVGYASQATVGGSIGKSERTVRRLETELNSPASPIAVERTPAAKDEGRGRQSAYRIVLRDQPDIFPRPTGQQLSGSSQDQPDNSCPGEAGEAATNRTKIDDQPDIFPRPTGQKLTTNRTPDVRRSEDQKIRKDPSSKQLELDTLTEREREAVETLASEQTFGTHLKLEDRAGIARDLCAERPDLDIAAAIAKAGRWLRANPRKAPTSHWRRFLLAWVRREGKDGANCGRRRPLVQGDPSQLAEINERAARVRALNGVRP